MAIEKPVSNDFDLRSSIVLTLPIAAHPMCLSASITYHRPAGESQLEQRFAGGPMVHVARFRVLNGTYLKH